MNFIPMINPLNYDMDLRAFLKKNVSKKELDFIIEEEGKRNKHLEELSNFSERDLSDKIYEREGQHKDVDGFEDHVSSLIEGSKIALKREISFTKNDLLILKIMKGRLVDANIEEDFLLDFSDMSAVEKIIFINELEIINYLRSKPAYGISNNLLASVLSGITGIRAETIAPSLNRLDKNDLTDNKHPYFTVKTVERVKLFLSKLGF